MGERFQPPLADPEASSPRPAGPFPARGTRAAATFERLALGTPVARIPNADELAAHRAAKVLEDQRQQILSAAREEGLAEGRAMGLAESQDSRARLLASVEGVSELRRLVFSSYRQELVELALSLGQALVQREIVDGRSATQSLVDRAIESLGTDEPLTITLCAHDASELEEAMSAIVAGGKPVTVDIDARLEPGDLEVRCASGSVESLLSERLAKARSLLEGAGR